MASRPSLSDAELEVLKALWDHGPGTVRQINDVLGRTGRRWAYTTVLTLLHRLGAKRYVATDASGTAHVFSPAASREDVLRDRLDDLADELCEGGRVPMVLALVEGHRFSDVEIARFRALLDRTPAADPDRPASPES